jgi:hypothetical protein
MSYGDGETAYEDGPVRRGGQIEQALDELDEALHMLGSLVEEAHGKLGPALRPDEPRPTMNDREAKLAAVAARTSPLADRLLAARSRTRSLVGSLGELLERVDL